MPPRPSTVRTFAPELWGEVGAFANLYQGTYTFSREDARAVGGVGQHYEKAMMFMDFAIRMLPGLDRDDEEMERLAYTSAIASRELGLVLESAIVELYSSIDCAAKVVRAVHGKVCRGFKASTRGLFKNFERIDGLPEEIKAALRKATWYNRLRYIRDELTHLATGACRRMAGSQAISYVHPGIQEEGVVLVIEDFFAWFDGLRAAVNSFLGEVFRSLRSGLSPAEVVVMCGVVEGRALMRWLDPTQLVTFHSGRCGSWQWFEEPGAPTCPMAGACGAYVRARPAEAPREDDRA